MKLPIIQQLQNGLKIALLPQNNTGSVTIHLKGRVGSNLEKIGEIGSSHLLEHILINNKLNGAIQSRGGVVLGITSRESVLFMTKILNDDLDLALKSLKGIFELSSITNKELKNTKHVAMQEIKRIHNSPERLLGRSTMLNMYENKRTQYLNIGDPEIIKGIKNDSLFDFYKKYYVPNNFVLVISGDINREKTFKLCEKLFGGLEKGEDADLPILEKHNKEFETIINFPGLKQSISKINFYGPAIEDNLQYSAKVLAKTLDNLLKVTMKEDRGLVYSIGCQYVCAQTYGVFSIFYACNVEKQKQVEKEIFEYIENADKFFNTKNLFISKRQVLANLTFNFDKTSQRAEYYSNVLLHGREDQNHIFEMEQIESVDGTSLKKLKREIFSQKKKVVRVIP